MSEMFCCSTGPEAETETLTNTVQTAPCPTCGRCPTCGGPFGYVQPWYWQPNYWQPTWTITTSSQGIINQGISGVTYS